MKTNLLLAALFLLAGTAQAADIKISQLPLGSATTSSSTDSFPYVSSATNVTKRLTLWDVSNIPSLVSTYATKASPTLSGTVTFSSYGTGLIHSGSSGILTSSLLVNADVSDLAAISRAKLATGTAYRLLVNNSSGLPSENAALTTGRVPYADANGQLADSASLFWDSSNSRLSVGGGSPSQTLDVQGVTRHRAQFIGDLANDGATGSAQTLSTAATPIVRLTSGTLVSVAGVPAGNNGQFLVVMNASGVTIQILDESASATAGNRIRTGTGADFAMQNNASVFLIYDNTSARWRMIGGGGGGAPYVSTFTGTAITPQSGYTNQTWVYTGSSAQSFDTTGFGTLTSLTNGTTFTIVGSDDSNTLTIDESDIADGRIQNGSQTLGRGQFAIYQYNSTLARMVLIGRSL